MHEASDDWLDPLMERLRRTVIRFGGEPAWRPAVDSGEDTMGNLTWADLRRLDDIMRTAVRTGHLEAVVADIDQRRAERLPLRIDENRDEGERS